MNLDIRAWSIQDKTMEYIDDFYWFEENGVHDNSGQGYYRKYEFMLYTGLKDRTNDEKIYDKDLIKALNRNYDNEDNWRDCFETFEVTYLNGCWMFGNWNAHEFFNKFIYIKVIGNNFEGVKGD